MKCFIALLCVFGAFAAPAANFNVGMCAIGAKCNIETKKGFPLAELTTFTDTSGGYVESDSDSKENGWSTVSFDSASSILAIVSSDEDARFAGWYTCESDCGGEVNVKNATKQLTDSVWLTTNDIAKASKIFSNSNLRIVCPKFLRLYSITAEIAPAEAKQGGTISISGEGQHGDKYEEGTDVTLSVSNLKEGFSVDHWEDEDGVQVFEEGAKRITVEVTGNAKYTVKLIHTCEVRFNDYGGADGQQGSVFKMVVDEEIEEDYKVVKPPTKEHATFLGYFPNTNGTGVAYWNYEGQWKGGVWDIYSNVWMHACYEEFKYTVRFNPNGGVGDGYQDKHVTYTESYELPDGKKLSKPNCAFGGWAMSADADKAAYAGTNVSRTVAKDESHLVDGGTLTYYAFWTDKRRTVRFVAGSDEVTLSTNGVVLSTNEMKKVAGEKYGELPTAVWDGDRYEFDGWWTAPEGGDPVNADSTVPDQDDISLYAHWAPNSYYIAFDGRGATGGAMAVEEFKFDQPQALTANGFEKTGCEFRGWATNLNTLSEAALADGAVVSNLLATVKDETNTIYAVWKGNSYSVRFFGNGGTNEMSDQEFEYGVAQKLTANAFGRANYEFIGWAKDPAQAVAYTDEQEVSNLSAEKGAIVPLYAKWKWTGVEPTELSIAADCDKLALTTNEVGVTVEEYAPGEDRVGLNNQYILMCPPRKSDDEWEAACYLYLSEVKGKGTLSFYYKTTFTQGFDATLNIFMRESSGSNITATVSEWTKFTYVKTDAETVQPKLLMTAPIQLGDEKVYIDYVTWTPEEETEQTVGVTFRLNDGTSAPADVYDNVTRVAGAPIGELPELESEEGKYFAGWMTEPAGGNPIGSGWIVPAADVQLYAKWNSEKHPVPGPGDEAVICMAAVQDGRFDMAFSNKQWFAYEIWTNSNIAVPNGWALKDVTNSTEEVIIFSPEIDPAVPTMFYKVKTIQRP